MFNLVTCEKTKSQVIFMLNNYWNCNYTDFVFPLPNYDFLQRKHLDIIKNGYLYTIKNIKHKRAVFMLYKNHEDLNKQYLIFRDNKIIETNISLDDDYYYSGSIFDVTYDSEKVYIYDTYMIGGYIVNSCEYNVRHGYANLFPKNDYIMCCKKYNNMSEIGDINPDEEIYFVPNEKSILSGTVYCAYRWRPSELISFGLKVKENDEVLDLYTTNFKCDKLFARISGDTTEKIKKLKDYRDGCIVNFNVKKLEFDAENVQSEQEYPTNIRQIEKIILIKNENITFCDFF